MRHQLIRVLLGASALLWARAVLTAINTAGVFSWIGVDYGMYWAGAQAVLAGKAADIYQIGSFAAFVQPLQAYYGPDATTLLVLPSPYPAAFFALLTPLAVLPPVASLAAWTLLNLCVAGALLRRLLPGRSLAQLALVLVGFLPLAYGLWVGQAMILAAAALYAALTAFRRGEDFRAGLWCGLLMVKPQYALVLALVLVWQRRRRALVGLAASASTLLLVSAILAGPDGIRDAIAMLQQLSAFHPPFEFLYPQQMVSWRGLVAHLLPGLEHPSVVVAVLSLATLATIPWIWRGRWEPGSPRFARQMLATVLVAMLVSFHNHLYGATLLVVPALLVWTAPETDRGLKWLLAAGLVLPTSVFFIANDTTAAATVVAGLQVVGLGILLIRGSYLVTRRPADPAVSYQAQANTAHACGA